jgi:hypothetical protein
MDNQKYDFTNKAIHCEKWYEMQAIASIARINGLNVGYISEMMFIRGNVFFILAIGASSWRNENYQSVNRHEIVTYADFISGDKRIPEVSGNIDIGHWWENVHEMD